MMDLLCLTHPSHRLTDEIANSVTFCSVLSMLFVSREIDLKIFCLVRILKHIGDNICRILSVITLFVGGAIMLYLERDQDKLYSK